MSAWNEKLMKKGRFAMNTPRLIGILGIVLVLAGLGLALDARQVPPKNLPKPAPLPIPLNRADLQVSWIKAWPCACLEAAAAADAMILKGPIVVHVANAGPKAADAKVSLECNDLNRSGNVQIFKDIHLGARQEADLVFLEDTSPTHMVLLKKSAGIYARIMLPYGSSLTDPNSANDTKRITACTAVVD